MNAGDPYWIDRPVMDAFIALLPVIVGVRVNGNG